MTRRFGRAGLKARPHKTHGAEGTPTGHRFLGNETGCEDEQLGASRNGFVSGWYEHASRRDRVMVGTDEAVRKARTMPGCPSLSSGRKARPLQCPDQVGNRPAGTPEALPGTKNRTTKFKTRNSKRGQPRRRF